MQGHRPAYIGSRPAVRSLGLHQIWQVQGSHDHDAQAVPDLAWHFGEGAKTRRIG